VRGWLQVAARQNSRCAARQRHGKAPGPQRDQRRDNIDQPRAVKTAVRSWATDTAREQQRRRFPASAS
jgi:hypothetical protein